MCVCVLGTQGACTHTPLSSLKGKTCKQRTANSRRSLDLSHMLRLYRPLLPFLPVSHIGSDFSQRQAAIPQRHLTVPEFTKLSPSSFIEGVLIKHQLCTKHGFLASLFSLIYFPTPASCLARLPSLFPHC